jgi:hypothetical protein
MTSVPADADDLLFEALTPVGLTVRVTRNRWLVIVSAKHPVMAGREFSVREALERPDEVRRSRIDPEVLLVLQGGPGFDSPYRHQFSSPSRSCRRLVADSLAGSSLLVAGLSIVICPCLVRRVAAP